MPDTTDNDIPFAQTIRRLIAEHLGPGPELTEDQRNLLAVLTDPADHDCCDLDSVDPGDVMDELRYAGNDQGFSGAQTIADILSTHYDRRYPLNQPGRFVFGLDANADGEICSYTISVDLGGRPGYLTSFEDPKYLNPERVSYGFDGTNYYHHETVDGRVRRIPGLPPAPSALRKAITIAEVLDGDYRRLRREAATLLGVDIPD